MFYLFYLGKMDKIWVKTRDEMSSIQSQPTIKLILQRCNRNFTQNKKKIFLKNFVKDFDFSFKLSKTQ